MPEGDTVWLAARRMHAALSRQALTRSDFRVPALSTVDRSGDEVVEVVSVGKHLLTRLDSGLSLHTHFKMDGSWHLYRPGVRWTGGPDWTIRVVLETDTWQAVGYRLPVVDLIATADEVDVVGHLGPDLLGPQYNRSEAIARVTAQPDHEIAQALLDQRNVAGIGNLYKAETLFMERTSPWRHVAESDVAAILDRAQNLLERNKHRPDQSTTGRLARGQQHYVFERVGKPCRRCGTPVRSAEQGDPPYERITYWCPSCQAT